MKNKENMGKPEAVQALINKDREQLGLLSIFYYIFGGSTALFSFFPLIHVLVGLLLIIKPGISGEKKLDMPFSSFLGWLFIIVGISFLLLGLAYAVCLICTGRFLAKKKHYLFCLVVACLACMSFPFGTTLGILTIIVVNRESVKEQFKYS